MRNFRSTHHGDSNFSPRRLTATSDHDGDGSSSLRGCKGSLETETDSGEGKEEKSENQQTKMEGTKKVNKNKT